MHTDLAPIDVINVHLVSKRFLHTIRGSDVWKVASYGYNGLHGSPAHQIIARQTSLTQHQSPGTPVRHPLLPVRSVQNPHQVVKSVTSRAIADWDPSFPGEKVDWYGEYIARHAPISQGWIEQPTDGNQRNDIGGLALVKASTSNNAKVFAPLDDGSVCLWNLGSSGSHTYNRGTIIARSKSNLLSVHRSAGSVERVSSTVKSRIYDSGMVECVSVDNVREKAYVAVQSGLNEVDLRTLQISSFEKYPCPISAISEAAYPVPLTVGTNLSLHLHDPRQSCNARSGPDESSIVDSTATYLVDKGSSRNFALATRFLPGGATPREAGLIDGGPLSITHLNSALSNTSGEIYISGRFPSILMYDRRTFPKLSRNIYSGARLSSLASVPYPLLQPKNLRRSEPRTESTLVACGEYKGKGSLELYAANTNLDIYQGLAPERYSYKNRVSASRSKLLSVASHGTRLVFSDSDGNLMWIERDGSTRIRWWNINTNENFLKSSSLFANLTAGSSNVARKILHTCGGIPRSIEEDELLIWTGEKIGLLGFGHKPRLVNTWSQSSKDDSEVKFKAHAYAERMRRALGNQADEVRFMARLGFPARN